ncbi:hypothetical protein JQ581_19155 [Bradyrhizobium liaoningense]|uniref:hypothetical protein n=1 Tax=Bradyrhizobium liaoningense TaxID=43992 RepID=UPI001BAB2717|nr:hypothetical protein [Bradyrhizobium liaoningense]MBR0739054.1 hypothetical protein [Bradyrhizobium liaoningense]
MRTRPLWIIAFLLLVAHAPLWLNDSLVADDWLVLKPRPDYAVDLGFMLHGAGHPIIFGFYSLANLTGAPILFMKIVGLVAIVSGGVCLLRAAIATGLLTSVEAVGFSVIAWTYPGYVLWTCKGNTGYITSFALSCIATYLLTLMWRSKGAGRVLYRIGAALIYFFSFALNSTMILYAFAMLGLYVAVLRAGGGAEPRPVRRLLVSAWRCAITYPEFVVLPVAYWGVLNIWFKRVGPYAEHYNAHFPSLSELIIGWRVFFRLSYWEVAGDTIRAALHGPTTVVLALAVVAAAFSMLPSDERRREGGKWSIWVPLLLGAVFFLVLSLPYLAAGLRPARHFYETRHLLMFGIPLALGLLGLKRLVETRAGARAAFAIVFGSVSVLSIAALWNGYVFQQARSLKQEALSSHLAAMPQPAATVFNLDDGFLDYPSPHTPFGLSEVTGMIRLAWGNQPFFGFTLRTERPTILQEMDAIRHTEGSAFRHFDPSGPQATILLRPGPDVLPNEALVGRYYACRLLGRCELSQLLAGIADVSIKLGPIAEITPLDGTKTEAPTSR